MNIKTKKIAFGALAALTAVAVPVATVVSCGGKDGNKSAVAKPSVSFNKETATIGISYDLMKNKLEGKQISEFFDEVGNIFNKALKNSDAKKFTLVTYDKKGHATTSEMKRGFLEGFNEVKANIWVALSMQCSESPTLSYILQGRGEGKGSFAYYPSILQDNPEKLAETKPWVSKDDARRSRYENPDFSYAESAYYWMKDAIYGDNMIKKAVTLQSPNKGSIDGGLMNKQKAKLSTGTRLMQVSQYAMWNKADQKAREWNIKGYTQQWTGRTRTHGEINKSLMSKWVKKYGSYLAGGEFFMSKKAFMGMYNVMEDLNIVVKSKNDALRPLNPDVLPPTLRDGKIKMDVLNVENGLLVWDPKKAKITVDLTKLKNNSKINSYKDLVSTIFNKFTDPSNPSIYPYARFVGRWDIDGQGQTLIPTIQKVISQQKKIKFEIIGKGKTLSQDIWWDNLKSLMISQAHPKKLDILKNGEVDTVLMTRKSWPWKFKKGLNNEQKIEALSNELFGGIGPFIHKNAAVFPQARSASGEVMFGEKNHLLETKLGVFLLKNLHDMGKLPSNEAVISDSMWKKLDSKYFD